MDIVPVKCGPGATNRRPDHLFRPASLSTGLWATCLTFILHNSNVLSVNAREEAVLRKCRYFASIGAWPSDEVVRPKIWLSNFEARDRPLAVELLDAFVYYNGNLVSEVFRHSLSQLRNRLRTLNHDWNAFASQVRITFPTGEVPSPADSGHVFLRQARTGVLEVQIVEPKEALEQMIANRSPVLFVDDFLGSGSQMYHTWERKYEVGSSMLSFSDVPSATRPPVFYCCAFATQLGMTNLASSNVGVDVIPAYRLGPKDGVLSPETRLLDPGNLGEVQDMIRRISLKVGFPDSGGSEQFDWRGFAGLGLALSLEHGTPDATLPMLYKELNGWRPLVKRK